MGSELGWPRTALVPYEPAEEPKAEKNFLYAMRKSLTKREIVKKKPEIDRIFKIGKRYSNQYIRLVIAPNGREVNRIVVIPVRRYGNSVQRNRIRRQIKEIWRLEKTRFAPGFDFAFVVYPGKVIEHARQKQQLTELFQRAGVYLSN